MASFHSSTEWKCTELVLIRHAESTNNVLYEQIREKFGADVDEATVFSYAVLILPLSSFSLKILKEENRLRQADSGLSQRGIRQIDCLKNFFNEEIGNGTINLNPIDHWSIYSSPMKRCLLTAQQVSVGLNNKIVTVFPFLYESHGCYRYNEKEEYVAERGYSKADVEV